jgi:hypothetical protein
MNTRIAASAAFLLLSFNAYAELPKEISAVNDNDEIILTVDKCPLTENYGFENYAYVVRVGHPEILAEGCWKYGEHSTFDIWIPAIKSHFQLRQNEFKPRVTL